MAVLLDASLLVMKRAETKSTMTPKRHQTHHSGQTAQKPDPRLHTYYNEYQNVSASRGEQDSQENSSSCCDYYSEIELEDQFNHPFLKKVHPDDDTISHAIFLGAFTL